MAVPVAPALTLHAAFNDPEHADVRLHLSTAAPGDGDERPAKKPRTRRGTATEACAPSHARSYYAPALVLSAHSAYFKARLGQDSSRFKPDDVGGAGGSDGASTSGRVSTPQIRFEIVEHVDEADQEAMDMLLRMLYGAQVESTDAELLLRALHLADRFLVSAPVAQLLASRLVQVPCDAITADIVLLAYSERSGTAVPLPKEFLTMCDSRHPAVVFWHVPAVVTTPDLLARFCSLSHAAVLAWAADDDLGVHSKNDVVYFLSEWVEAQKRGGRPCSAEQLKQLVHAVRLSDCGPAYLQSVLPALDWFQSGHKSLRKFALFRGLKDRIALGSVFSNGFWMTAYLRCSESKTTPGELTLGYYVKVDVAKMRKAVPWPELAAVGLSRSMEVGKAAKKLSGVFVAAGSESRGFSDSLHASSASVAALVAPHLEEGELKGKVTFFKVDLVGRA
ncbi:hypothetical protein FOA52_006422 [Chlamydomonas sp. UWO 241]|nr:hypothetical protein FOA52_006422 [Chlamydomonas sp. UWO 241]